MMEKKNIVFIRSNPVNPDSRVEKEVNSLLKKYHNRVLVIGWDRSDNYKEKEEVLQLDDTEGTIIRFGFKASFGEGMKNIIPFLKFQMSIMKWLIRHRREYEVIHACDFDTAFTSIIVNKLLNKKFIFDIFDYLSTDARSVRKKIIRKLENYVINNATATIICTEKRIQQIDATVPKNLTIIHNSPNSLNEENKNRISLKSNLIKVVYVGILQDFRLLKEIAEVIIANENCELHIGGFGKYEEYFKKISEVHDNIVFYGKLSYRETLSLESECDIMTAIYDPCIGNHIYAAPNKFYEGLMLGKPLIMVKGTGMSEILDENNIGVLIDFDKDGFESGLNELINKRDTWSDMSKEMKSLYINKYSWQEMENRLFDLYTKIDVI